ncbi:hypothetical protein HZS_3961 [Henneguya salminicola]|nr:hypothetical protein HZS_3961 [Henneguya salminicola]
MTTKNEYLYCRVSPEIIILLEYSWTLYSIVCDFVKALNYSIKAEQIIVSNHPNLFSFVDYLFTLPKKLLLRFFYKYFVSINDKLSKYNIKFIPHAQKSMKNP